MKCVQLGLGRLDAHGVGHRPQRQVGLDGGDGLLAELGDQLLKGAAQWPRGTAAGGTPWASRRLAELLGAAARPRRRPAPSGAPRPPGRPAPRASRCAGSWPPGPASSLTAGSRCPRAARPTVANSDASDAHSSVTSGRTFSWTSLTTTSTCTGVSPRSASKSTVSPALAPGRCSSSSGRSLPAPSSTE